MERYLHYDYIRQREAVNLHTKKLEPECRLSESLFEKLIKLFISHQN